jgi:hypothetical protein
MILIQTASLNPEMYIHILIIALILLTLKIGISSSGVYKSAIAVSGVLMIFYSVILYKYIFANTDLLNEIYVFAQIFNSVILLIGVLLIILGVSNFLNEGKK